MEVLFILILVVLVVIIANIKVVPQAHAYIVERLGGYNGTWGVGLHVKMPFIDKIANKVSLKEKCRLIRLFFTRLQTRSCTHMALSAR